MLLASAPGGNGARASVGQVQAPPFRLHLLEEKACTSSEGKGQVHRAQHLGAEGREDRGAGVSEAGWLHLPGWSWEGVVGAGWGGTGKQKDNRADRDQQESTQEAGSS